MKLRKGYIFCGLMLLVIGVMARYIFSDINLNVDLLRESLEKVPVIEMENLEFEREISGDLWWARIPLAIRRSEFVEARSPDVKRTLANGKEWYFKGTRAFYSEATESADLADLIGTLETDERVLNLESPGLSWSKASNVFLFPDGLTLYDDEFFLESSLASADPSGIITLDEGAVIRWNKITQ